MISLRRSFLFVHVPRTGGNSIQNVLRRYSEDTITTEHDYQDGVERFGVSNARFGTGKHSTLQDYKIALGPALFASLFKFAVVRNPWDRAISHYFSPHRRVNAWDRNAFLKMLPNVPVLRTLVCEDTRSGSADSGVKPQDDLSSRLDFLLRFERLDDDFARVCERIGIPHEPLVRRNASARRAYAHYYDEALKEIVGDRFSEEIAAFGYDFDPASRSSRTPSA